MTDINVIKASLYYSTSSGNLVLSNGYSHIDDYVNISKHTENAIVDAIKNIDITLIK
ncbi:hypothetical protein [Psychrilyobacter atlanticus]|uniref:hypothetical protein n=1 Tax=Psychrilyobacter atlanticus TaxID=271091 RepID=UPI000415B7A0|nr:hypothetical protein [Psychrilyobacter atlanticus]